MRETTEALMEISNSIKMLNEEIEELRSDLDEHASSIKLAIYCGILGVGMGILAAAIF